MSLYDPNPSPILNIRELVLQRRKYGAGMRISEHLLETAEIHQVADLAANQMLLKLEAEILADKVMDEDVTRPWSGTAMVPIPKDDRSGTEILVLAVLLTCAAVLVRGDLGLGLLLAAFALVPLGVGQLVRGAPGGTVTFPVNGTLTVSKESWREFPENTIRYPKELGRYVRVQEMHGPYWEQG